MICDRWWRNMRIVQYVTRAKGYNPGTANISVTRAIGYNPFRWSKDGAYGIVRGTIWGDRRRRKTRMIGSDEKIRWRDRCKSKRWKFFAQGATPREWTILMRFLHLVVMCSSDARRSHTQSIGCSRLPHEIIANAKLICIAIAMNEVHFKKPHLQSCWAIRSMMSPTTASRWVRVNSRLSGFYVSSGSWCVEVADGSERLEIGLPSSWSEVNLLVSGNAQSIDVYRLAVTALAL